MLLVMSYRLSETDIKRLKAARLKLGLTQAELADKLGVSQSTVCSIERGRHHPSCPLLIDWCDILGLAQPKFTDPRARLQ